MVFNSLPIDAPLRITSPYGKRKAPKAGATTWHAGVDLGGDWNKKETAIKSVKSGKVVRNYWNDSRGWVIVIEHNPECTTLYQHLREQSPLTVGTKVWAGMAIGIMGNTGISAGAHLHFELWENGKNVDPTPYLYNIQEEVTRMSEQELIELIERVVEGILSGRNSNNSKWFKVEFDTEEEELLISKLTDGSRPQGFATREEVTAMVARAVPIVLEKIVGGNNAEKDAAELAGKV